MSDKNLKPRTLDELMDIIKEVTEFDYTAECGYEQTVDSMWQASVAAFNYAAHVGKVSGAQASFAALRSYGVMEHIEGPYMIVRLHDCLYPQYDKVNDVRRFIHEQELWLHDEALRLIKEAADTDFKYVDSRVLAHWANLVVQGKSAANKRDDKVMDSIKDVIDE